MFRMHFFAKLTFSLYLCAPLNRNLIKFCRSCSAVGCTKKSVKDNNLVSIWIVLTWHTQVHGCCLTLPAKQQENTKHTIIAMILLRSWRFDLIVNLQFICAMCMCARVWVYCVCVCLNLMFALCSLFKSHHFFPTWLSRCKVWSRCFHLVLFYFPLTGAKSRCRRNCGPTAIEVFYRMNQRSINPCGSTILFVLIYAFDIFNMHFSTQFFHSFFVSFGYCNWGKAWCRFQSCFPCTWN